MPANRRDVLKSAGFSALLFASKAGAQPKPKPTKNLRWAKGFEGQRQADLGNGTFLNPIMAGD